MSVVDLIDSRRNVHVVSDDPIAADNLGIRAVTVAIDMLHSTQPIAEFRFVRDVVDPINYLYRITLRDGRIWTQRFFFDQRRDPRMTFTVPLPGWRLTEFEQQRSLRLSITALRSVYNIERVIVTYAL